MQPVHVGVLGGGIAGLAAAFELHARGIPFALLEASSRAGGLIFTERFDGFTIDAGPDSMLVQKPAAVQLCRELGLGERLRPTNPPRRAFVLRGTHLHALPERSVLGIPADIESLGRMSLLTPAGRTRLAQDLELPRKVGGSEESIAGFVGRRLGEEAVQYIAQPLLAGIHAGDARRLSVRALFPRLVEAEVQHGSLLRAFGAAATQGDPEGLFRSLPGGLGELIEALLRAVPIDTVHFNCTATNIETVRDANGDHNRFVVHLRSGETLHARRLIVATPAYVTAQLLRDVDAALADLCGGIPYASAGTVMLAYSKDEVAHPLEGSGFVVPPREGGCRITACTWVSSKWPGRAPPGHVLVRAFVGGALDEAVLQRDDEDIAARAHEDLARVLGITASPLWTRVYRWDRANAQYELGHLARVASIDDRLHARRGLFLTGSGFRGTGIPDCIADARATAQAAALS